ncbi:MAG: amidophosphoribosyltransferase [Clostridia bacterium]|nr:amidophosphoribosyltransferase [Clostridia bacterium]
MTSARTERHIHEECGVFGLFSPRQTDLAALAYYGLFALQHRGQESAGIVVNDDGVFQTHKDVGLVSEVFSQEKIAGFQKGNIAVGHVRYGTTGSTERVNSQPLVVNHVKGHMALCHNGNLVNSFELRRKLELNGAIFHTTTDTEVITYVITNCRLRNGSIEQAVNAAMDELDGAYSLVLMSPSKLIAVRDPYGFRPLCYGQREDGTYVVASETCALDAVNARFVRDIEPGEILCFTKDGLFSIRDHCGKKPKHLCIFEYIYFSRPDSVVDGVPVIEARMRAGEFLSRVNPVDADIVIGVPDSGIDAAIGYSHASGIPYGVGLIKNRYIARTFISPGQKNREDKVRIKLNPVPGAISGKRVIMVDDSIVRGTTSARIVKLLRDAGAKEVHMRVSAPPFVNPCYYGTDVDSKDNLIACHHSIEEIAKLIGVDSLAYLPLDKVDAITGRPECGYCSACFGNPYPTQTPQAGAKNRFETRISEGTQKEKTEKDKNNEELQ